MTKKNKLKKDPLLEIAQLRESEDRWRTLAVSSPDHILTLAPDLTIEYANHPAPGLTIEDLIGVPITSFVDDEKQEEIKSILFGVISTGQEAIYETEYPTPDGGMIYYETHAMPRESAGKVIGLMLNSRDCTKRKNAELKLEESERKYRALYENAPLPYQSLDKEGRLLDVNPAWLRTLGYKRDQVIGENFADFLHPDSKPQFEINFPAFIERGYVSDVQFMIRHRDGNHLPISFEGCIGYTPEGKFKQTYCVFQDITERKYMEEALAEKSVYLDNILRSSTEFAIATTDLDFRITSYNPLAEQFFGYSAVEVIGKTVQEMHTQERVAPERFEIAIKNIRDQGEYRYLLIQESDSGTRNLETWISGITDLSGELIGYALFSHDVTERMMADEELHESEEKFRILYNNSPDMFVSVSPVDGSVLLCNETLLTKTGYSKGEIIGHNVHNLYHDDCLDEVKEAFQEFVGKGEILDRELVLKRKDGGKINVSLNVDSVRNNEGEILYSISSLRDIAERKQIEKKLREKEEKFSKLFDTISSGVVVYDVIDDGEDFIITDCNPSVETIERVKKEDIVGKRVTQAFPGVKDFGLFEVFQRVSRTGEPENFPQAVYKDEKDPGSWRDNWVYKLPGGEIVAVYNDITERKQTEKKILKNQYYLTKAQEIGKIGTWELDIQKDILRWTDETYKIFDVPSGTEMNLERMLNCVHPDDQEFFTEKWNAALKNEPYDIEHRIIVNDDVKWVREKADIEFDSDGSPVMAIGFAQDITEVKRAEQALTHSHDLMTYIIEHNRSSIAVHDTDLKYIYVSKRYLEEYNVKDPDIIGKHHYDVFPDLPQKWRDVHQKALAGEIFSGDNDPYYRDDGTVEWTRWECRPWYEEGSTIGGIIVYTELITDRILAEQEKDILMNQVQEANERLRSLSKELINSQEAERKRISQELHDELGQALTAISLDLGIIEQNLHPETPPEIRDRLFDTKKNADELDQMIRELALDLRPSLLDDLGLLPTLNWYVKRFSQRAKIEIEVEVNGEEKRLPDEIETALYRIVQEALTNVVKHAKAKKVGLRIDKRADVVMVIIKDDGKGFDLDTLQLPETSTRGLGLIGMADRTALVGGEIKIYSKPGEGTRIEVEIPC